MGRMITIQIAALFVVCSIIADEPRKITEADRVVAIYNEDWGLTSAGDDKLLICAWEDGTVVWSQNKQIGGPPFLKGKVDPKTFDETISRLKSIGVFDVAHLNDTNFGPDAEFTTILIRDGDKVLKMQSWHEVFESGGILIATSGGVTSLNGSKLLAALADEPSKYLAYRVAWLEIRLACTDLIPATGEPTTGNIKKRGGIARWVEP
jgi:hypothetical protein